MRRPISASRPRRGRAGALRIAGIDEVGRGPLAGPVVAAAVIFVGGRFPDGLADSKLLTADRRMALDAAIRGSAEVAVGVASVTEIDVLNILRAAELAMARAVAGLGRAPCHALVDGNRIPPGLPCAAEAVVKGDARCLTVAAASIVAKVWRDRLMVDLAQQHPGYGWETNMGYGTESHRAALVALGATPHHRRSFRPVHNILYQPAFISA